MIILERWKTFPPSFSFLLSLHSLLLSFPSRDLERRLLSRDLDLERRLLLGDLQKWRHKILWNELVRNFIHGCVCKTISITNIQASLFSEPRTQREKFPTMIMCNACTSTIQSKQTILKIKVALLSKKKKADQNLASCRPSGRWSSLIDIYANNLMLETFYKL